MIYTIIIGNGVNINPTNINLQIKESIFVNLDIPPQIPAINLSSKLL
jgi:hypothetical protein